MPPTGWRADGRVLAVHLAAAAAAGLVMLLPVWPAIDTALSDRFYDAARHAFPLKDHWFLEAVMHRGAKRAVAAVALAALAGWVLSRTPAPRAEGRWMRLRTWCRAHRRDLGFLCLAIALATTTVSGLKYLSPQHCPWDLTRYGGYAPHILLFQSLPEGIKPGRCFPGGHASGGFALMALYFPLRRSGRKAAAWLALAGGIAAGLALGIARMMQGAHFLSHNLWSGIACWTVIALLAAAVYRSSSADA